ncbi:unnamed protein product [Thelazia callipaeda]|uniref:FERM domain-containing protein n=1 Tax=Thelazia callipaeda TaxID=103827 RepID=A0A0N5CMN2_THECL|nr:unnamed protein product [Thelazia callipaeda]
MINSLSLTELLKAEASHRVMTESDEVNSYNGSSSYGSSRIPRLSDSEQRLSESNAPNFSSDDLHRFNIDHVKVIPSLHTTIPPGFKYLQVHTLTKETVTLAVHVKCRVQDAYLCCCSHLGFDEERLFGLALRTPSEGIGGDRPRNEYFFLEPNRKITKYAPKQWKISHAWNTVVESRPFLALHLRVRVYVDKVHLIGCSTTLRHYYLQLRENLLDQWSGSNSVAEERCWELAALALHADENGNDLLSFRAEQYFPLWVVNVHGLDFVRRNISAIREDLRTCSSNDAIVDYCQQASRPPFALNCHLYGLRRHKMDTFDNAVIGISPKGIETSDVGNDGERIPLRKLQWNRIAKLSFDKRKLTITGIDGASLSLYAQFENKARYLLEFCKAFHQATLFISNQLIFRRIHFTSINSPLFCNDDDPLCSRRSLNSRASSNSTSGVVSDKPGSEADKDCEWTDICGMASDCSCEEMQAFTSEDLAAEIDKTSLNTVPEVAVDAQNELGSTINVNVDHLNTSSSSGDDEETREGSEVTEFTVNAILKQPPQYTETLESFHSQSTQNKPEIPYQRSSANPNVKPRWITVAGFTPSMATVSCPLETSTHLAYSEPKLHYQLGSHTSSPPTVQANGLFQKRYGQRLQHSSAARGISRVQSMPAHNAQHYLDDDEHLPQSSVNTASVKYSHSSPGTRFLVHTKQPPSYEHAVLQQSRVRYAQKASGMCTPLTNVVSKDILSERHSYTSDHEKMTLNSRIRKYPMMRALWQEHQQGSCGQLATNSNSNFSSVTAATSATRFNVPSVSNPILSSLNAVISDSVGVDLQHLQLQSSCQELASSIVVTSPHFTSAGYDSRPNTVYAMRPSRNRATVYHQEIYVPENSAPSCCYYSPYAAGRNQSWIMSHSILDLPPPPPYPPPRCPPSPTAISNPQMVA